MGVEDGVGVGVTHRGMGAVCRRLGVSRPKLLRMIRGGHGICEVLRWDTLAGEGVKKVVLMDEQEYRRFLERTTVRLSDCGLPANRFGPGGGGEG